MIQPPLRNLDDDDIFGVFDQYNLFGDDNDFDIGGHQVEVPHVHSPQSAIENLLKNEANITRDKIIEKKKSLMAYQRIQAIAIVRYIQLTLEGHSKMKASAEVAMCLYQKKGMWTYKARSIRGWSAHYLKTGNIAFLSLLSLYVSLLLPLFLSLNPFNLPHPFLFLFTCR